jgi:glycogen(starch) synthase
MDRIYEPSGTVARMRIAMISWEYPPLVVGGIAAHVDGLSRALVRAGHEVTVLTLHHPDAADDAMVDGVRVVRARTDLPWLPPDNFLAHMASANHHVVKAGMGLGAWTPDVVHAHDWLVAWAGDSLRTLWDRPLVATIHATERGRNQGYLPPGQAEGVNATEWWLTYIARRVICCSQYMKGEVVRSFSLPDDKIDVVPNGVDPGRWTPPDPPPARGPGGPLIVSWGRLQAEKGFQTLVYAMAELRHHVPGVWAVVAGQGSYLGELNDLAHRLGVANIIRFAGFVPDEDLLGMLHRASCAVIPSLYEPFGIVALEAMAAGAPVVAAATGGLVEVLGGTDAGFLYPPGDASALAGTLRMVLTDAGLAARCSQAGLALAGARYSWDQIAIETLETYRAVGAGSHP